MPRPPLAGRPFSCQPVTATGLEVVTALIEYRVSTSLADVEKAIARWRSGAHSALAAHGAVLRHAARLLPAPPFCAIHRWWLTALRARGSWHATR